MANAVYGVILNFRAELEFLGDQLYRDPYKKPPVAPVLYLRPQNTWERERRGHSACRPE